MELRRGAALLVYASVLAGCGHAPDPVIRPTAPAPPPLRCPADGGMAWSELTSAHFTLRTDVPEGFARQLSQELEETLAAMVPVVDFLLPPAGPPSRTSVIVLQDLTEFKTIVANVDGFYLRNGDERHRPLIVTSRWASMEVFRHELLHRLVRQRLPRIPRWLDEGLAEYFQRVVWRDGKAILGAPSPRLLRVRTTLFPNGAPFLRPEDLPSVLELVGGSEAPFRSDERYYIGAWTLVHLLANGSAQSAEKFRAFIDHLGGDDSDAEAMAKQFGELAQLEPAYRAHLTELASGRPARLWTFSTPFDSKPVAVGVRPLDDGDVHLVRALLAHTAQQVALQTAQAHDHAPSSPSTWFLEALRSRNDKRPVAALDALNRAIELAPDDPFWRYERLTMAFGEQMKLPAAQRQLDPLGDDMRKLARQAHEPDQLALVAQYYGSVGQLEFAMPFIVRALDVEPLCPRCLSTLALLQYQRGHLEGAVLAEERALQLTSGKRQQTELRRRLDCFRRHSEPGQPDESCLP